MKIKRGSIVLKFLIIGIGFLTFKNPIKSSPTMIPPSLYFDTSFNLIEPVTNCGVEIFTIKDTSYAYIFNGMDSTLKWSGIHKRCYKVNLTSKKATRLPDLPDSLGRIALSATRIGNKIYVVGGYHVFSNGSEKSSSLVHEFDPIGDTFTLKKTTLPIAIDDNIQLPYRDSLIYVIGGWSNTKNVSDVQIYDPKNNIWFAGTPLPDSRYTAFGATGYIEEDPRSKLAYLNIMGGASDKGQFPAKNYSITGEINTRKVDSVTWSILKMCDSCFAYRSATVPVPHSGAIVIGGNDSSYNFNAIDYKDKQMLSTTNRGFKMNYLWVPIRFSLFSINSIFIQIGNEITIPMDIRDIGHEKWSEKLLYNTKYKNLSVIAGGILNNQKVSDQLILITSTWTVGIEELVDRFPITVFPNPSNSVITFQSTEFENLEMKIYNSIGEVVLTKTLRLEKEVISIEHFPKGVYIVKIKDLEGSLKIIKQ